MALLCVVLGANAALLATRAGTVLDVLDPRDGGASDEARDATDRFFDRSVTIDGRVARRDQGDDTVSEGQAYAMLLAAAFEDRERFDRVWRWTERNLQRPDGLLAWRWQDGEVVDDQPASDADLDAARALVHASRAFGVERYERAAVRIARAIVEHETVRVGPGPLLVAGPWARTAPYRVNPGYFSPAAFAALRDATRDTVWDDLRASGYALHDRLTASAPHLPPDWAEVRVDGATDATGPPDTGDAPVFGPDATRALLRLAEDCDPQGRRLAARSWPFLRDRRDDLAIRYGLDGRVAEPGPFAPTLVAAAAAAHADGSDGDAAALLDRAADVDREHPTYFGSALVALGRVLLTTDLLRACPAD